MACGRQSSGSRNRVNSVRFHEHSKVLMLDGKIAIVTGASRGLGAGIARELAANGARVILAARTLEPDTENTWGKDGPVIPGSLNETLGLIRAAGGFAESYRIDLSSTVEIQKMVAHAEAQYGGIDILVNCAMGFPESYKGEVWNTGDRDWHAFMDIGVRAKYLAAHFASRVMMRRGSGMIANISAGASRDEYYNPLFRMAMAGVDRMTAAIASDLRPHGISAVSIWPRWVRTERVLLAVDNDQLGFEVSEEDLSVSDTPEFTGRAIAHLACDSCLSERSGQAFPVVQLAHDYGFTDIDGRLPAIDDHTRVWAAKLAAINKILNSP
jgi:dehydrogenase/reductase SDR family protein 1